MPDLTRMTASVCDSNREWETTVTGSKGAVYTIRFGTLFGRDAKRSKVQCGYTCTCPGFQHHGHCKHVQDVHRLGLRCGWNAGFDPGLIPERDVCPDCGGPLYHVSVGV